MRKPRDYDAELKALGEKARQLRARNIEQLGELVIATGADVLPVELLAGGLIAVTREKDAAVREGWRKAGAGFFQRARRVTKAAARDNASAPPNDSGTLPFDGGKGAS